ncbi:hypothetical protein GCM10009634_40160 [Saccharothrix xinjiangensis]
MLIGSMISPASAINPGSFYNYQKDVTTRTLYTLIPSNGAATRRRDDLIDGVAGVEGRCGSEEPSAAPATGYTA